MNRSLSRRKAVHTLALGMAGSLLTARASFGTEPQRLAVGDPAAAALGYVEDADQVDLAKYPAFVKGSRCENCLQLQGTAGSDYRPCSTFGGKLVAVRGWCAGWTAEM